MTSAILVLNSGSSSLKFAVYESSVELRPILGGQVEGIGTAPRFQVRDAGDTVLVSEAWSPLTTEAGHRRALRNFLEWLGREYADIHLVAAGHRIVHGGDRYAEPIILNEETLHYLRRLEPLAPLHQPHNLAAVQELADLRPDLLQVGCFDTAFHRHHPESADYFALPLHFHDKGIRRYGFHGLSYEYIARRLAEVDPQTAAGRVVVAHLGNGASLCGMINGHSMDCTLSFGSLDGLPMGTRCGRLDPGVILHLAREFGHSIDEIEDILTRQSGLLGLSGVSNDMRDLLQSEGADVERAIELFVYSINAELGRLVAILGGLDALVFTAGIGEHAPEIRQRVCEKAAWLGIAIDESANHKNATRISTDGTQPTVWVIPTNEERMIALQTQSLATAEAAITQKIVPGAN